MHKYGYGKGSSSRNQSVRASLFRRFFASVVLLALAVNARAQEWTRFRGPNGSGVSDAKTVPAQWTDADTNWKVTVGYGHSSPVVWGQKIFVTSGDPDTARRSLLCLDAASGKTLWKYESESVKYRQHRLNAFASSTPTVDAERVYAVWSTPESYRVLALDHAGKEVWTRDLGPFSAQHGSGASPILVGDLLVVAKDAESGKSALVGLDTRTGAIRWQYDRTDDSAAYATPCVFTPPPGTPQLIFTSRNHGFTSLDPKTGKANWELAEVFDRRVVASPITFGDMIIGQCGEGPNGTRTVAIRVTSNPQIIYKVTQTIPYVPSPLVKDGLLYLWTESGIVRCLRATTGEAVWQEKVGGNYYSSPVCVGGRLYNVSVQGEVVVVATGEKFELLGHSSLGEGSHATPAIANGILYWRTFTQLISVGGKK